MNIILGHTNLDMDCMGSMALAHYLYPDYRLVGSRFVHPSAKNLFNLYQNHLNLLPPSELAGEDIGHVLIVDTRNQARVKEYFDFIRNKPLSIQVFDHHAAEELDIPGARLTEAEVGSNTALVGMKLMERGIAVSQDDATVALAGIYADTGNFTFEGVTKEDFQVASWLVGNRASLKLVKNFLKPMRDEFQITLFHEVVNNLFYEEVNGHFFIVSYLELEKQTPGLAAVVEKVFEVEDADAFIAVFYCKKEGDTVIIARSQKDTLNLPEILKPFGGGGHRMSASALVKNSEGKSVFDSMLNHLRESLAPAIHAEQIMTRDVGLINENWDLRKASMYLETINRSGAPVISDKNNLVGFMTLKDIMKARKSNQMHSPVKAYMTRKVVFARPTTTIREIEYMLYTNNVGHLPILENDRIIGIVTRSDYLHYIEKKLTLLT
ncbi:MAG: CBS domain-containing protein [Spirochaetales bacterium]|nr:MAG: CBS domain-containing protein [Spirochaetales bacterium]